MGWSRCYHKASEPSMGIGGQTKSLCWDYCLGKAGETRISTRLRAIVKYKRFIDQLQTPKNKQLQDKYKRIS